MPVTPSVEPRRLHLRRWLIVLAPACATMVVALVAFWVLLGFLRVRDRLGVWHLTVRDDHGTVVARGVITLVAEHWNMERSDQPPYLRFVPDLARDAGTITMTAAAPLPMTSPSPRHGTTCPLQDPYYQPEFSRFCCSEPAQADGHVIMLSWGDEEATAQVAFDFFDTRNVNPMQETGTIAR